MANVTVEVPEDLARQLGDSPAAVSRNILLRAAMQLCRAGELSTSQAARLAGLTYAEFLEAAVQRNADLYDYPPAEVDAELGSSGIDAVDLDAVRQELARAQARRG